MRNYNWNSDCDERKIGAVRKHPQYAICTQRRQSPAPHPDQLRDSPAICSCTYLHLTGCASSIARYLLQQHRTNESMLKYRSCPCRAMLLEGARDVRQSAHLTVSRAAMTRSIVESVSAAAFSHRHGRPACCLGQRKLWRQGLGKGPMQRGAMHARSRKNHTCRGMSMVAALPSLPLDMLQALPDLPDVGEGHAGPFSAAEAPHVL